MRNLFLFFNLILCFSCQPEIAPPEDILTSKGGIIPTDSGIDTPRSIFVKSEKNWYSELHELNGFENFEEENGILLGKNHSVGIYFSPDQPQTKLIIFEKIRHKINGEAVFLQLHSLTIHLAKNQFLTTDFCKKENNNFASILAIFKKNDTTSHSLKIVKAWHINQKNQRIEPIESTGVKCLNEFL